MSTALAKEFLNNETAVTAQPAQRAGEQIACTMIPETQNTLFQASLKELWQKTEINPLQISGPTTITKETIATKPQTTDDILAALQDPKNDTTLAIVHNSDIWTRFDIPGVPDKEIGNVFDGVRIRAVFNGLSQCIGVLLESETVSPETKQQNEVLIEKLQNAEQELMTTKNLRAYCQYGRSRRSF